MSPCTTSLACGTPPCRAMSPSSCAARRRVAAPAPPLPAPPAAGAAAPAADVAEQHLDETHGVSD